MEKIKKTFHLEFNRWLIEIELIDDEKNLYKVHFLNEVPDLIIEKSEDTDAWRSIDGDRDDIAQQIGSLINKELAKN